MAIIQADSPFPLFTDKGGDPLDGGFVYFGEPDLNPEESPKTVYYDAALAIATPQPLRTSNGYITRNGAPAAIYSDGAFSMTVRDRNGALVFYSPSTFLPIPDGVVLSVDNPKDVSALLADTSLTYATGQTGTVAAGDIIRTLAEGFSYEVAASDATDHHVTTAGGVKLYVLPGADGRANLLAFGFTTAAANNDTEMTAALASGLPLLVPGGVFKISIRHSLTEGADILGVNGAVIEHVTADLAHFFASDIDYFAIRGVTLRGTTLSTGVTAADQRAALVIQNTHDFDVEFCTFETLVGSGVTISRGGTYVNGGRVRFNRFIKGSGFASADPWGTQDNAPVQVYQYAKNITVEGNVASGKWYCGFLAQDQVNDGASRIYGLRVVNNKFSDLSQYGIILYTLQTVDVSGIADNGSSVFRVTTTADHNLNDGDKVHLLGCGDANGIWEVDVQTATTFDLVGSVYSASVSNGTVRMSENCSGYVGGNTVEGVDGDREFAVGNRPYGAGFYVQGAGGIVAADNIFRRTNLNTNSETLTPASIGVNGATGTVTVNGGGSFDSGWQGISLKQNGYFGCIRIGGGLVVSRTERESVRMASPRYIALSGIEVITKPDSASGRILAPNETDRGNDVVLEDIICQDYNVTASSNFLELNEIDGLVVRGLKCVSTKPAAQSFELARFIGCTKADVCSNVFDGGESAFAALVINGCTDSKFRANRVRMQDTGTALAAVRMQNTCTGTVFHRDNDVLATDLTPARMENTSTGGKMHTRDTGNGSGGKTRQIGDTIENSDYADTEALFWIKTAVSTGASDWKTVVPT